MEIGFLGVLLVSYLGMGLVARRYGARHRIALLAVAGLLPLLLYLTW